MGLPAERVDPLERARERLRVLIGGAAQDRPKVHTHAHGRIFSSPHVPWEAYVDGGVAGQRAFVRSRAAIRVIVAGRQAGKTHQAAEEVARIILARPGTESCLLMPTYKSTKGARRHLERALAPIKHLWTFKSNDQCYTFTNGATLYIRTADDKTGVPTRGLTIDGVLWVDEASFVPRSAWNAAQFTQGAVAEPKAIVTTTPKGRKSWVFDLCKRAMENPGGPVEFFRFRTFDSPHVNQSFIDELREQVGRQVADEELNAVFLGDADLPFHPDDIFRAFHGAEESEGPWHTLPIRGERLTIGLDLGKKRDYTVATLMNEWGEAWVLERFRSKDLGHERFWPRVERRIAELAEKYSALLVIDLGGGLGSMAEDHFTELLDSDRVYTVNTGTQATKTKVIEALISDFEAGRILVSDGPHAEALHFELSTFPRPERVDGKIIYKGAKDSEDEHDDCVISLALARWGRDHAWERDDSEPIDPSQYKAAAQGGLQTHLTPGGFPGRRFPTRRR